MQYLNSQILPTQRHLSRGRLGSPICLTSLPVRLFVQLHPTANSEHSNSSLYIPTKGADGQYTTPERHPYPPAEGDCPITVQLRSSLGRHFDTRRTLLFTLSFVIIDATTMTE